MDRYYLYNGKLYTEAQLQEAYGDQWEAKAAEKGIELAYEYKDKVYTESQLKEAYGDNYQTLAQEKGVTLYGQKKNIIENQPQEDMASASGAGSSDYADNEAIQQRIADARRAAINTSDADLQEFMQNDPELQALMAEDKASKAAKSVLGQDIRPIEEWKAQQDQGLSSEYKSDVFFSGLNRLNEAITSIPESVYDISALVYDIAALPQNALASALDLPEDHWLRVSSLMSAEELKKELGVKNLAYDYYKKEGKKIQQNIQKYKTERYGEDTDIWDNIENGNYKAAGELLAAGVVESAPLSLGIMASGSLVGFGATAAGTTVALTTPQRDALKEKYPNLSNTQLTSMAVSMAAAESVFESIGGATIAALYKGILKKEGAQVGRKVFRETLIDMYQGALKKYGLVIGGVVEGLEEFGTQVTQNMIEGRPIFEGASDAFLIGMASGVAMSAPAQVYQSTKKTQESIQEQEQAQQPTEQAQPVPEGATQPLEQPTEQAQPSYSINGNELTRDEFVSEINSMSTEEAGKASIVVNNDQEVSNIVDRKMAPEAVSEPTPEKVSDLIDRPVVVTELGGSKLDTPIEGSLYQEGQQVVVEDADGNITELGNIDEISDKTLQEMGIQPEVSDIKVTNKGNLQVGEDILVPDKTGIKKDKKGNVNRVVLRTEDGAKTVTLRGRNAEEAAYQILLKEATSPEQEQRINDLLENDEQFQNELREATTATEAQAATDTQQVTERRQAEEYSTRLNRAIESNPDQYWSVDPVTPEQAMKSTVVMSEDGGLIVTEDGDMKGLFKDPNSTAKGVAADLLRRGVEAGGRKGDNFDGYLTEIYKKNGFRVTGRVPFNEEYAPKGWNKAKHGTPDVVAIVYDPQNKLDVTEKTFDSYDDMIADRDSYLQEQPSVEQEVSKLEQLLKPNVAKQVENAKRALSRIAPNIEIIVAKSDADYRRLTNEQSRNQSTAGTYSNGKIYINPAKASATTVAHEVFHAILLSKGRTNAETKAITDRMMAAVRKNASADLIAQLDEFASQYDSALQSEESIAELFGLLANNYATLSTVNKNVIKRWLDKLAKVLGLKPFTDAEVIDLLNTVSGKVATGAEITEADINILNKKSNDKAFNRVRKQATQLKSKQETLNEFGLTGKKNYNVREIAEALQRRTRKLYKHFPPSNRTDNASDVLSNYMVDEILFDIEINSDNSAVGWYTEKYQTALDILSELDPSLKEQDNRDLFTMFLAVTSDGQKVGKNFELAYQAYSEYKNNGKVDANKFKAGDRTKSIQTNINNINNLLNTKTINEVKQYLLTESTVSDLKAEGKSRGIKYKSNFVANELVPKSAAIFGEKLGMFYANLSGSTGYLTMDRWWSRTFNRYRGELIPQVKGLKGNETNSKGEKIGLAKFKEDIGQPNISDKKALEIAKKEADNYRKRGYKNGSAIEKSANTIYKAAFVELNDAPFNAGDRSFMINTVKKAQSKLKDKGYDVSIADMQAILWYFEKMLYIELGGKAPKGISYLEAAQSLVDNKTIDESPQLNDENIEIDTQSDIKDVITSIDNVNLSSISSQTIQGKRLQLSNINTIINVAKQNNISDQAIKQYLLSQGFTQQQIDDAFNRIPKSIKESQLSKIGESSRQKMKTKGVPLMKRLNDRYNRLIEESLDRQSLPKRVMRKAGLANTPTFMVANAGASSHAKRLAEKAYDRTVAGLSNKMITRLEEIIFARRVKAIDTNRAERAADAKDKFDKISDEYNELKKKRIKDRTQEDIDKINEYKKLEDRYNRLKDPIIHPKKYTSEQADIDLEVYRNELGDKDFNDLIKRADNYFDEYRSLLNTMREEGLIDNDVYEMFAEVDYQPRQFLNHITDINGDLLYDEMYSVQTQSLADKQIQSLQKGSDQDLYMDAFNILESSILSRAHAVFSNRMNKTFAKEYSNRLEEINKLKEKQNPTKNELKEIADFEALQENILMDEIVDYTSTGKPKYKLSDAKTIGYKPVYYYENGVKNRIWMKKPFFDKYTDTNNQYLSSVAKENIALASGTAAVKTLATGKNPLFFLTNTPRDFMFILAFSPEYSSNVAKSAFQLMRDASKGVRDVVKGTELYDKYIEYGGGMDFLALQGKYKNRGILKSMVDATFDKKTQDKIGKNPISRFLDKFNLASEVGFRMAVFNKSIKNQLKELGETDINKLSKEQQDLIYTNAVKQARQLTDFNQGGRAVKALDAGLPYLNAAVQGTRAAASNLKQRPLETTSRIMQITAYSAATVIGSSIAAIAAFRDDDDEEIKNKKTSEIYFETISAVSQYDLDNYFIIPLGIKDDRGNWKYLRIAKSQALTPYLNASEHYIRKAIAEQSNIEYKQDLGETMMRTFETNISPLPLSLKQSAGRIPLFDATMALYGFDSYTGNPLSWDMGKIPEQLEGIVDDRVEPAYKELGKVAGQSPVRLQSAVESFITTPSTNPYIGLTYGLANTAVSLGDTESIVSDLKNIGTQSMKRLIKSTSEYNEVAKAKERMSDEIIDVYRKHIEVEADVRKAVKTAKETGDTEKALEKLNSIYKENPEMLDNIRKWYKSEVGKKRLLPLVSSLRFQEIKEVKAIILADYFGKKLMKSDPDFTEREQKVWDQLKEEKVIDKEVVQFYVNMFQKK